MKSLQKFSPSHPSRRDFVKNVFIGATATILTDSLQPLFAQGCADGPTLTYYTQHIVDKTLGINEKFILPRGLEAKILLRSMHPLEKGGVLWHEAPDGAAIVLYNDEQLSNLGYEAGAYGYVSNSEALPSKKGGARVADFDAKGNLIQIRNVLWGTTRNCQLCLTPWNTILSFEETVGGQAWETNLALEPEFFSHPHLGKFQHESGFFDTRTYRRDGISKLFMTEDDQNAFFYQFVGAPNNGLSENGGQLSALSVFSNGELIKDLSEYSAEDIGQMNLTASWTPIHDHDALLDRDQFPATFFNGSEGVWMISDHVFFSTKFDNRIWRLNLSNPEVITIHLHYDQALKNRSAELTFELKNANDGLFGNLFGKETKPLDKHFSEIYEVDQLAGIPENFGEDEFDFQNVLLVAEDKNDNQIPPAYHPESLLQVMALRPAPSSRTNCDANKLWAFPLVQVLDHCGKSKYYDSEITGIAIKPDLTGFYGSSQRGKKSPDRSGQNGCTFEIVENTPGRFKEILAGKF